MSVVTSDFLLDACRAGGPSCLSATTELRPAAGPHASVAPAKFSPKEGKGSVYAFERRYDDGAPRDVVVIDSKQSQLNRAESALQLAIDEGDPVISRMPRIEVTYQRDGHVERWTDLQLPHRAFDGHIRAGTIGGEPAASHPAYLALRDASPVDASALLRTSPITLAFGGWDASRKARQGRWRSVLVGEIIGFCADTRTAPRGAARVDPVAMQVLLTPDATDEIRGWQESEFSPDTANKIKAAAETARKKGSVGGSVLGLGGIPPRLDQIKGQLAGVSCDRIVRSHVLSFAALRQMRFGDSAEGDVACRAVLAALALNGMVRSYAELCLRANCDLTEVAPPSMDIDRRGGQVEQLTLPSPDEANVVLEGALATARRVARLEWDGQVLRVEGNPAVVAGAVDADEE